MSYYVEIDGAQAGPYTISQLREINIHKDTLIWIEGMDNWLEAKYITELKEIIMHTPPPLPSNSIGTVKVQAEITNKKRNLFSENTKIIIAKEINNIVRFIPYSILIGVVFFPIYYFIIYNVPKYNDCHNFDLLDPNDFPIFVNEWNFRNYVNIRVTLLTDKSFESSGAIIIISNIFGIITRFIVNIGKWAKETAKNKYTH